MNDKLQTGDYCEVTREQAIQLLNIEHYGSPEAYCNEFFGKPEYPKVWVRANDNLRVTLSAMMHGGYVTERSFEDFKQRLINTVKNK